MKITLSVKWLKDVGERMVTTFLQAFFSTAILDQTNLTHIAMWKVSAISGVAAALSLLKGTVASGIGEGTSASLLPSVGRVSAQTQLPH